MASRAATLALVCATTCALAAACVDSESPAECEYGTSQQSLQAQDRNIIGAGGNYPSDPSLRGREEELYRSQAERRQVAWRSVEKILAPIALAKQPSDELSTIPLWRSWYGGDEVTRLFQRLYSELNEEERRAHARFPQAQIDEALGWNLQTAEELANWPSERRDAYLAAIDSQEKLAGIAGIGRTSYSPDAMRHLLRSYPEVLGCMDGTVPQPVEAGESLEVQQVLREPISLVACASKELGLFVVAPGEELRARIELEGGADAQIWVQTAETSVPSSCDPANCVLSEPGSYTLGLRAGGESLRGVVHVDYVRSSPSFAGCLESVFPKSAVVVKADWRRAQFGALLPVYDTSAAALTSVLAQNDAIGWGQGDRQADPSSDEIYTLELPSEQRYRLTALHIMTKELDHWQWITLWWSDHPDTDFGADRPAGFDALGPWQNYKMCVVTDFSEGDAQADGGFAESAPTLAAALKAVYSGQGAPSWCSNPYLELGAGNMTTNCIGCHQHGGTYLVSEEILSDETLFPAHGRAQLRNNFPHDYSWSIGDGDRLGLVFKSVVDYFDR